MYFTVCNKEGGNFFFGSVSAANLTLGLIQFWQTKNHFCFSFETKPFPRGLVWGLFVFLKKTFLARAVLFF